MAAGADAKSEGDAGDPVVPSQKLRLFQPSSSSTPITMFIFPFSAHHWTSNKTFLILRRLVWMELWRTIATRKGSHVQ